MKLCLNLNTNQETVLCIKNLRRLGYIVEKEDDELEIDIQYDSYSAIVAKISEHRDYIFDGIKYNGLKIINANTPIAVVVDFFSFDNIFEGLLYLDLENAHIHDNIVYDKSVPYIIEHFGTPSCYSSIKDYILDGVTPSCILSEFVDGVLAFEDEQFVLDLLNVEYIYGTFLWVFE